MRKNFKNVVALVLAVMMLLVSSVAFADAAANTYTVASPSKEDVITGHTYKAYQIFTATSYNSTDKTFGNLAFSSNVTSEGQTALLNGASSAQALADSLGTDDSAAATAFAKLAFSNKDKLGDGTTVTNNTTELSRGLWLVVDETTTDVAVINWANLFVSTADTDKVQIVSKVDAPESDKSVKDFDDLTGEYSEWQKTADYDIGDDIPFKLTATLPGNYTSYETYHLTFHDQEGTGLTFKQATLKVYLNDSTTEVDSANYTVKTSDIGSDTFQVVFTKVNLDAIGATNNSVIRVEYDSTLNDNAVIGQAGNPNTFDITYDNNPNSNQEGEEGGETPKTTVIVFTYRAVVDKVEADGYETYANEEAATNDGAIKDAASGKGYVEESGVLYKTVDGVKIGSTKPLSGADFKLYKKVKDGTDGAQKGSAIKAAAPFTDATIKALADTALENNSSYIEVTKNTNESNGTTFSFKGIDDGTYVLAETQIPAGYNGWEAQVITVTATITDPTTGQKIDPTTGKIAGTDNFVLSNFEANKILTSKELTSSQAKVEGEILNQKGSTLPATGGVGTTIFYVAGSIMVLAAAILLITKRRMGNND